MDISSTMIRKGHLWQVSAEAIGYQNDALFRELTLAFETLLQMKPFKRNLVDDVKIPDIVKRHTGISIKFVIDPMPFEAAYVIPPDLTVNHPLMSVYSNQATTGSDYKASLKLLKQNSISGQIHRSSSRVSGDFTKITSPVYITEIMITGKRYTADELAAILLHEVGHVFTYFECIADTITTNYAMLTVSNAFTQAESESARLEILKDADAALDIAIPAKDIIASGKKSDTVQVVIANEMAAKRRSEFGSPLYDRRSWEFLADQFCSRHGATVSLAKGLDKLYRGYGDDTYRSSAGFLILELVRTVVALPGFLILVPLMILLSVSPLQTNYDKPRQRLVRLRQDLVLALRDRTMPKAKVTKLLDDVKAIDTLMADMKDRDVFIEKAWAFLSPWSGRQVKETNKQKQLEALAMNELYVAAAQFKTL